MTTLTATKARASFASLLKKASQEHKMYRIHHRAGDAVLLSEADYDGLVETLKLLSIPGFRASMKRSVRQQQRGQTVSFDEVFGRTP